MYHYHNIKGIHPMVYRLKDDQFLCTIGRTYIDTFWIRWPGNGIHEAGEKVLGLMEGLQNLVLHALIN